MPDKQPNIVFFYWDNFGWGELGCYGGGILRGAPTPRIDAFADEGLKLSELQHGGAVHAGPIGALDRSAPDPLGHSGGGARGWPRRDDTLGGDDRPGAVRCRVRDGDVGQWHLGSDPETRSPVDFGFDEAVWSPRTADEVLWTMQSYFPNGDVTSEPYASGTKIPVEPQTIYSRKKGEKPQAVSTYDAEWKAGAPAASHPWD